jgi:hypothetical protein
MGASVVRLCVVRQAGSRRRVPPALAGNAWFALGDGRMDVVALASAGYAAAMTLAIQAELVWLWARGLGVRTSSRMPSTAVSTR